MRRTVPIIACCSLLACNSASKDASKDAPQDPAAQTAIAEPAAAGDSTTGVSAETSAGTETGTNTDTGTETGTETGTDTGAPLEANGPPRLLIATDEGLAEYDLDGKRLGWLSRRPASWPRVLSDGTVLFLSPGAGKLELVAWSSAGERSLAQIPQGYDSKNCGLMAVAADMDGELELQDNWDFRVDEAAGLACIELADRNDNMMDIGVSVSVPLAGGAMKSAVTTDLQGSCPEVNLDCGGNYRATTSAPSPSKGPQRPWSWDQDHSTLIAKGGAKLPVCRAGIDPFAMEAKEGGEPKGEHEGEDEGEDEDMGSPWEYDCAGTESISSSGRFVLLSGPTSEGDYIHRELFFADLDTGKLFAFPHVDGKGPHIEPTSPDALMGDYGGSLDAVGESDIRWLPEDRLWVDGLLINPASQSLLSLGGQLAHHLAAWP